MSMDKKLMRETFKKSAKETVDTFKLIERVCGRYFLYRMLFNYPKKWSKRKVKKKGSYDIQILRLDYGLRQAVEAIEALGPEYKFEKEEEK